MKKKIACLMLIPMLLVGCGGKPESKDPDSGNKQQDVEPQGPQKITYVVNYANTSMQSITVDEGSTISRPSDPSKANSIFVGWYLDASMTQEASFPLLINKDTTIYAKFYSYQDAFEKARDNTIGSKVNGYEYDYTLQVSAGYMGLNLTGNTLGNSKYNAMSDDVTFYDSHTNSGALFNDGSKYLIKKGRDLHEVSLNEDGVVKKYDIKDVGEEYKYDSSSFAKAVFEYDSEKLKEIKPTTVANEYSLKTGFNASSGISLIGNYLNHPMVEKIVGELPETSVNTGMFVTFAGDKLSTYRYQISIDVTGITFNLTYNLTFKNPGEAPSISPKVFNNTYVASSDLIGIKTEISGYLNSYKALEKSSYNFTVKTGVDFPSKNSIDVTVDGFTKRNIVQNNVYFLNDYEVDTDLKNKDLYDAHGLKDYHGGRAKLSNNEVHNLKKKVLGGYNDFETATYNESDDYYLLDIYKELANITFVQKIVDTSKNKTTYAIGSDTGSAVNILNYINSSLVLNGLKECDVDVKPYGNFTNSLVTVKNFKFQIVVADGVLSEIALEINGKMTTSYPNSRDFTADQDAGYYLKYSLKVTDKGSNFEPADSVGDL